MKHYLSYTPGAEYLFEEGRHITRACYEDLGSKADADADAAAGPTARACA